MDIIKPLAGKWGLMTPSGPILGLYKRWKIKLRSKLQPACSRAVYQQCAKTKGKKEWVGCFSIFICCCFAFSAYFSSLFDDRGTFYLWETYSAKAGCCKSVLQAILLYDPEQEWWFKMKHSGMRSERLSPSLLGLVYLSSPQLSHISAHREAGGMNQARHHSLCPSL